MDLTFTPEEIAFRDGHGEVVHGDGAAAIDLMEMGDVEGGGH